jgi:heme-degrading monooxygenase HmoA
MRLTITGIVGFTFFCVIPVFAQTKTTMNPNTSYSVEIIRYSIAEDQRAKFEEAYAQAGSILRNSPYCLSYEMIHGVDEAQRYMIRIHWTSVDDHLNGFRKSKEFGSFFNLVKPFYSAIDEMKHYELTGIKWTKE